MKKKKKKKDKKREAGFTLIELMICVCIIGILAAVAIPNYIAYVGKTQDSSAKMTMHNAKTALMATYSVNGGHFPH